MQGGRTLMNPERKMPTGKNKGTHWTLGFSAKMTLFSLDN
jgi:hypothetical protein